MNTDKDRLPPACWARPAQKAGWPPHSGTGRKRKAQRASRREKTPGESDGLAPWASAFTAARPVGAGAFTGLVQQRL